MCGAKPPKVKQEKPKDPAIIRNPYLDGSQDVSINRLGRNQLRIDPGTTRQSPPPRPVRPAPTTPRGPIRTDSGGFLSAMLQIAQSRANS